MTYVIWLKPLSTVVNSYHDIVTHDLDIPYIGGIVGQWQSGQPV